MPTESLWLTLRDDLVDLLEGASKAEGYWLDYGGVVTGAAVDYDAEKDYVRPRLFLMWDGEIPQDEISGAETAGNRFRHYERWLVSVAVKDEDPERLASRIRWDLHKALLSGSNRVLSVGRGNIYETEVSWEPLYEGGKPYGGVLIYSFNVRWDHVTGDMTTT